MKKILLIGKNSFIGKNFIELISRYNASYEIEAISIRDESWRNKSFQRFDVVIQLAAIVHQSEKKASYDVYDKVNHQLVVAMAKKAKEDGVKQFIFLSTMSVYGLSTGHITANTPINPRSFYARSKASAEQSLQKLSASDYRVAIIRPPMVYGYGNKGNYNTLRKFALSSLVFPDTDNRRSTIYVDNLCEFLRIVIEDNLQGILFPQNDEYMRTSDTVSLIAETHSKKIYMSKLLGLTLKPLMFSNTVQKAFGSLTYDPKLPGGPSVMDYNKVTFEESVEQTARFYKSNLTTNKSMMLQRPLDIVFSATGLIVASPLLIGATVIGYLDTGSPLFVQERIGKDKKSFKLIKFRTMKVSTESVASHLVDNTSITKLGKVLRKTKLDELPQLLNVLKGEMSLTGPRPNLFNQYELIDEREAIGVYKVLPGITGLAQLSNIDMSTPKLLAQTDKKMIDTMSFKNYFSYIIRTALGKGSGDAVK
ncbi:hybrid nucleoside-diphosphate sugar epimerase/sugar transferase [Psychrobacter urativorans]|uniref:hybrid nucleoside-diphosphate sugar epimerase/sugar transferase n=1 Tax=Psychrobacter urativorans TaxID=45610 RepID=UPI00191A343D|nr:hybrid nucleoside-diphosphate sugar epimerase/sugar transferase [Psychrobacter urativorans]